MRESYHKPNSSRPASQLSPVVHSYCCLRVSTSHCQRVALSAVVTHHGNGLYSPPTISVAYCGQRSCAWGMTKGSISYHRLHTLQLILVKLSCVRSPLPTVRAVELKKGADTTTQSPRAHLTQRNTSTHAHTETQCHSLLLNPYVHTSTGTCIAHTALVNESTCPLDINHPPLALASAVLSTSHHLLDTPPIQYVRYVLHSRNLAPLSSTALLPLSPPPAPPHSPRRHRRSNLQSQLLQS